MNKPFYLILPNIRSCHNVGSFFRTADAFGVSKIFLVGFTACPPKKEIDKVSLGAETWVPWEYMASLDECLARIREEQCLLVGLEQSPASVDLAAWNIPEADTEKGIALIVGNEVTGIAPEVLTVCDVVVHIPMLGKKESLNVSVAGGIALWELSQKIQK